MVLRNSTKPQVSTTPILTSDKNSTVRVRRDCSAAVSSHEGLATPPDRKMTPRFKKKKNEKVNQPDESMWPYTGNITHLMADHDLDHLCTASGSSPAGLDHLLTVSSSSPVALRVLCGICLLGQIRPAEHALYSRPHGFMRVRTRQHEPDHNKFRTR